MDLSSLITCGFCSNLSRMEIIGTVSDNDEWRDEDSGQTFEFATIYEVNKCPKCNKINIVSYGWNEGMEPEDEIVYEDIYPINQKIPLGLTEKVKSTFLAAEKVKPIDVNAYAILMRRLLEIVCLEKQAKGNTLAAKLKDLSSKNEIPEKLVDVAKGLKDFGNIGAHAGIAELTEREIPIVESLTRAILEYIYTAPHLATLAEKKLNALKGNQKN